MQVILSLPTLDQVYCGIPKMNVAHCKTKLVLKSCLVLVGVLIKFTKPWTITVCCGISSINVAHFKTNF